MRHISQSTGGAAQVRPTASPDASVDKWRILDHLAGCARDFGLSHRELNVLRALLSFLPGRIIVPGAAVVFPSNDTLSNRLNGLPESTLRRHLARLVASGLVARRDSPNRKRYARRDRSGGLLRAFGFDLTPLALSAEAVEAAAQRADADRTEAAALREEIALLRSDLLAAAQEDQDLAETARRMLRRHASPQELRALADALTQRLSAAPPLHPGSPAAESSGSGTRNERLQQKPEWESSDSAGIPIAADPLPNVRAEPLARGPEALPPDLDQIAEFCQEARSFFPEAATSWRELACAADKIAPMIGIPRGLVLRARQAMGWREAATAVLCLLERLTHIQNPAGYFSHLTTQAERGRFSLTALLQTSRHRSPQIVS